MILFLHERIRRHLAEAAARLYSLDPDSLPPIIISYPPSRALGDLAAPLAFELARRLKKAPRAIAQELAAELGSIQGIARVVATPNGYVNFYIDRAEFLIGQLRPGGKPDEAPSIPRLKTIVEHTAINPNKAAHIGHLRNAALGDTLVRLLQFQGAPVEVQNYIDDTGVQVADVVVGFRELERKGLEAVRQVAAASPRFDYYCWDLYARVTDWYEADASRLQLRAATLHQLEQGGNEPAEIAAVIADRIVRRHLETMARMNVEYDLLTWEGDILRLRFWAHAFEILKQSGVVFLQTEGKLAGCWVMRIEEDGGADGPVGTAARPATRPAEEGPAAADDIHESEDQDLAEAREKVIVRSDGTVTYVGKDIAYQFWKFGLLGRDFCYRVFGRRPSGALIWSTTADSSGSEPAPAGRPSFGGAGMVYNVIDRRQSYLQNLLKQALAAMGHTAEAERSIHFSYEMVALTHATARELGYQADEDRGRPFVEVSGRKGLGVKADDLLDRLVDKASSEVVRRNPELAPDAARRLAEIIAAAAVRYFMIKYSRGKVIAFDIDEALSFEGESGPYLQYAAVRANNIFNKLRQRLGVEEKGIIAALEGTPADALGSAENEDLWGLVLDAARLDEIADQAVRTLELSVLAKYAFGLAQIFSAFYHRYPILQEERADIRMWRAAAASYFRAQMTRAIHLMGFEVPEKM